MTTQTNAADAIVIERTLNAPVARVWKALTDPAEMKEWYFDLPDFRATVGFEFEFTVEHNGTSFHHLCKVTEASAPNRLAYSWRYKDQPGDSLVTFELKGLGQQTQLTITHEGVATFPKVPAYGADNFRTGWTALSTELAQFVEKSGGNSER